MVTAVKRSARSAAQTQRAEAERSIAIEARTYFERNKDMNEAKNESTKARKKGYKLMKDYGIARFETKFGNVPVEIFTDTPSRKYVDVYKLRKLVSEEKFMEIISASIKDVEEIAGKDIMAQCEAEESCPENLYVKVTTA